MKSVCSLITMSNFRFSKGTNHAPLLADLFLHLTYFLQGFLMNKDRKLAPTLNPIYLLNCSRLGVYLYLIYPNELEVNNDTDPQRSASYIDLHLEINNGEYQNQNCHERNDLLSQKSNSLSSGKSLN